MHDEPIIEASAQARTSGELAPLPTRPRIALAHDWLCGYRGGEGVLERLAALVESIAEPAGLWVMFDDHRPLSPTIDRWRERCRIQASSLNRVPGAATRLRRWLMPLYPQAVASVSRQLRAAHARAPIDLVISTSSSAIKNLTPPGIPHICICFSPARYVWSRRDDYAAGQSPASRLRGLGLSLAANSFRAWDRAGSAGVSTFIAISRHVQQEIERCYGRDSRIVFPPVRTDFFTPNPSMPREDFWLVVSALEPYKRVDLAIDAARLAGRRLVIAGTGSVEREWRADPPAGVEFLGRVTDEHLRSLYRRATLLLFPQVEDFGIVAVEAIACGCPVVARAQGGALDIVSPGASGALVEESSPRALAAAAIEVELARYDERRCAEDAARFSGEAFDRAMRDEIARATGSAETRAARKE